MKYRNLGTTGEKVSVLGFGGAAISGAGKGYGFGEVSEELGISMVHYTFERGVNLFDTAPIYGFGQSERILGKALKSKRGDVLLVSKSGVSWHENGRVNMTNDPMTTQKMLEQSLRDLQTDYIDVYMIHWPDKRVDIRRPMEVLAKAKQEQKIRYIGLCNTFKEDFDLASEIEKIDVIQAEYNLFQTKNFNDFNKALGFMSWGTLDKGILSGTVHLERKFSKEDCRSWAPWWKAQDLESKVEKVNNLKTLIKGTELSLLDLAIQYNLNSSKLSSALVGGKSIEQWEELLDSLNKKIPNEILKQAEDICAH